MRTVVIHIFTEVHFSCSRSIRFLYGFHLLPIETDRLQILHLLKCLCLYFFNVGFQSGIRCRIHACCIEIPVYFRLSVKVTGISISRITFRTICQSSIYASSLIITCCKKSYYTVIPSGSTHTGYSDNSIRTSRARGCCFGGPPFYSYYSIYIRNTNSLPEHSTMPCRSLTGINF